MIAALRFAAVRGVTTDNPLERFTRAAFCEELCYPPETSVTDGTARAVPTRQMLQAISAPFIAYSGIRLHFSSGSA